MAQQYVRDIKAGTEVRATFYLQSWSLVPFRDASKGMYLALTLSDKTGQIQGRVWERASEVAGGLPEKGIVRVVAAADEYRGQVQLTVSEVERVEGAEDRAQEFLPVTRSDLNRLKAKLQQVRLSVQDQHLAGILGYLFEPRIYEAFTSYPAAKLVHHAYVGGLLEHSLEVVEFCRLAAEMYDFLDRDLLIVGALFLDIGKIEEYSMSGAVDVTDKGRLAGHTALGLRMLDDAIAQAKGVPEEIAAHLTHLILSHHGELEAGAAVLPQTPEAMALHVADLFSAKIKQFEQVMQSGNQGGWSQYDRLLARTLYSGFAAWRKQASSPDAARPQPAPQRTATLFSGKTEHGGV